MNLSIIQDLDQKNYYNLSDSELSVLLTKLPHAKYQELVFKNVDDKNFVAEVIHSYKKIKSDSWPEISKISALQMLPEYIKEECQTLHKFNPWMFLSDSINKQEWNNYQGGSYRLADIVRYRHTILDNLRYIENKTVVDIAGHSGFFSLLCLVNNAKFVTLTDIRSFCLDRAEQAVSLLGIDSNRFKTLEADVHNYDCNTKISKVDTVLFFGILYHLHDHMDVLESITRAGPTTIIIDSCDIPSNLSNETVPLMTWRTEDTTNRWNGWAENKQEVFVGTPNKSWVISAMAHLNYRLEKYVRYHDINVNTWRINYVFNLNN